MADVKCDGNQLGTKEFRKALKKRLEGVDG